MCKFQDFLSDDFLVQGNDLKSLQEALSFVKEHTICEKVAPYNMVLFSLLSSKKRNDTGINLITIVPEEADSSLLLPETEKEIHFSIQNKNKGSIRFETLEKWGIQKKDLQQIYCMGFFFQFTNEEGKQITMIPSEMFAKTFYKRLGCGKLQEGINPLRDIYIANRMKYSEEVTLIYRTQEGLAKGFAAFSPTFGSTSENIVEDFCSSMKNAEVNNWQITHKQGIVDLVCPPSCLGHVEGQFLMRFQWSDLGDACYSIQAGLFVNGSIILFPYKVERRHTNNFELKTLMEKFQQEQFKMFYESLAFPALYSSNKTVYNPLKSIEKFLSRIQSIVGKKVYKKLQDEILPELCTESKTDYVNVLNQFLKIPKILYPYLSYERQKALSEWYGNILKGKEII